MGDKISKTYILTSSELTMIAAGKNIEEVFSVDKDGQPIDEAAICNAMSHLYQQGLLRNSVSGTFVLEEELDEIMEGISKAQKILLIRDFTKLADSGILYIGKKLIAIERSMVDEDAFRLYAMDYGEVTDFIKKFLQKKEKNYKIVLDEEQLLSSALKNSSMLKEQEAEALGNAILMLELLTSHTGKVEWRMLLNQQEEERQWLCYAKPEQQLFEIEENLFVDTFVGKIKEVQNDIG